MHSRVVFISIIHELNFLNSRKLLFATSGTNIILLSYYYFVSSIYSFIQSYLVRYFSKRLWNYYFLPDVNLIIYSNTQGKVYSFDIYLVRLKLRCGKLFCIIFRAINNLICYFALVVSFLIL